MKPSEKSVERLEKILSAFIETGVQPEEMMEAIDAVVQLVKQSEELLKKQIEDSQKASTSEKRALSQALERSLAILESRVDKLRNDVVLESADIRRIVADEVKRLEESMPEEPEGYDDEELREHIAEHKAILSNLSDLILGENIRNALEALPEGEKLAIEAIGGLQEALNKRIEAQRNVTALIAHRLDQIGDVSIAGVTDGQVLAYNATTGLWEAQDQTGGGGGGAVDSVNGQTGVVVLDADDIDDTSTTHKFTTASDISKLAGIEAGAEVNNISDANATDLTDGGETTLHAHAISSITGLQTALDNKLDDSQKGASNGLAELDAGGKVPSAQLPSFVDDVVEVANFAALPVTGETGKIYVTLDTNLTYRWSGSAYVEISASLALGETSSTAYRGDRGKIAYDHSQLTSGNPHNVTKSDVGLGSVDNVSAASLRDRSTHTGTQLASTISDFAATVRDTVLTGISFATSTAVTAADSILVAIGKLQAQNTAQDAAIALNTAKVTNATHSGDVIGSGALTAQPVMISGKGANAGLTGTEEVLINNAGTLEKTTVQDIVDLATGSVDTSFERLDFEVVTAPATPSADVMTVYLTGSGTSPTRTLEWKMKNEDGEEIILATLIT